MCVTDLDPDLDITEDEQMLDEIISHYSGVAWGRADRRDQDPAEAGAGPLTR